MDNQNEQIQQKKDEKKKVPFKIEIVNLEAERVSLQAKAY
jgi:hypothetical protein